jgi:hypothetical protein
VSLIARNESRIQRLYFEFYPISDNFFDSIGLKLDLTVLSVNCQNLSFQSIVNIIQSQNRLKDLKLCQFRFIRTQIVRNISQESRVRYLTLIDCRFTVKQFSRFIRLFKTLSVFEFFESDFYCECNPMQSQYYCGTCNGRGFNELSSIETIRKLGFSPYPELIESSILDSIANYRNLNTIEVHRIFTFLLHELAHKCKAFAQRRPTKVFTLILHTNVSELRYFFRDFPENFRLIMESQPKFDLI